MAKTKDKAFALFTRDKKPRDPEVKALGIKSSTRWNYYNEWKRLGKPSPDIPEAELGLLKAPKEKQRRALPETVRLLGGETLGPYKPEVSEAGEKPIGVRTPSEAGEVVVSEPKLETSEVAVDEANKPESETTESVAKPGIEIKLGEGDHEHPSIPEKVVGAGLPVTVNLSLKTLSFYEIAATVDPKLTLGDFLDTCAEDFFQGRGKDLGLIQIGG